MVSVASPIVHMSCNRFNILHTVASAANQEPGQEAGLKVVQQLLTESLPALHDLLQPQSRSLVLPVAQVWSLT